MISVGPQQSGSLLGDTALYQQQAIRQAYPDRPTSAPDGLPPDSINNRPQQEQPALRRCAKPKIVPASIRGQTNRDREEVGGEENSRGAHSNDRSHFRDIRSNRMQPLLLGRSTADRAASEDRFPSLSHPVSQPH